MNKHFSLFLMCSSFFVAFNANSYQLPTDGGSAITNACNNYSNKLIDRLIKTEGLSFKKTTDELINGKVVRVQGMRGSMFYSSMSAACIMGNTYAKNNQSVSDSVEWTKKSIYENMYNATSGGVSGDELASAIKNAVIYGRSIP